VRIREWSLLSLDLPDVTFRVVCSSGTLRPNSRGATWGRSLGWGPPQSPQANGHCPYGVGDALPSGAMGTAAETVKKRIIPLRYALPHFTEVQVDERTALHGEKRVSARVGGTRKEGTFPSGRGETRERAGSGGPCAFRSGAKGQLSGFPSFCVREERSHNLGFYLRGGMQRGAKQKQRRDHRPIVSGHEKDTGSRKPGGHSEQPHQHADGTFKTHKKDTIPKRVAELVGQRRRLLNPIYARRTKKDIRRLSRNSA